MEKKQKIVCISIVVIVIIVLLAVWGVSLWKKENEAAPEVEKQQNEMQQDVMEENIEENETTPEEKPIVEENDNKTEEPQNESTVEELKEATGTTGDSQIYQVEEEYDGRKVLAVKPSIQTKVAFAGMIQNAQPTMADAERIATEKLPKNAGIWINETSRESCLKMLNEVLDSTYETDENGYLKITNKEKQNQYDKKLEQIIQSDKQYLIDISSTCYTVDQLTGEIGPYLYSELDPYQTYYYLQDTDRTIIFLTENAEGKLTNAEIIQSVIDLI